MMGVKVKGYAALCAGALVMFLSSCADPTQYMGIDSSSASVSSEVGGQALHAQSGDEQLVRTRVLTPMHGEYGRIFATMVKLELYSNACLVKTRAVRISSHESYADAGWQCIIRSTLPTDCRDYAYYVLKAAKAVHHLPEFLLLQKAMPAVIKACGVGNGTAMAEIAGPYGEEASIFDIDLDDIGKADDAAVARANRFRLSSNVHSGVPSYPGYAFRKAMCRKLTTGQEIVDPSFWLLYCSERTFIIRGN